MGDFNAPLRASALLRSLTDEQRAFATAEGAAVCCIAAAGSGKTRAIAARVVDLVHRRGVDPAKIRVFVFTRSARSEIAARVADVLGGEVAARVDVTTFHSFAARVVVSDTPGLELAAEALEEAAIRSLYEGPTRRRGVVGVTALRAAIIRYESDAGLGCDDDEQRAVGIVLGRLSDTGAVARFDLLPRASALIEEDQAQRARWSVAHVLIDEAQDVTPREERIARMVGNRISTVADPRQSIMEFRGARGCCALKPYDVGRDEDHFFLSRSFRFGPAISAAANVVAREMGFPKDTMPGPVRDEVRRGVDATEAAAALAPYGPDAAVLCRTHDECVAAAADLEERGLPVHYIGRSEDRLDGEDPFAAARVRGAAVVSTIHAAKGREWRAVWVASGHTPRDYDDRRVLYVAMTRARELLLIGGEEQ